MTILTPEKEEWQARFVKRLAESGNITEAAHYARVSRQTAYTYKESDPEFAAAWDEAKEQAIDKLEAAAMKRAKETSDTLLIFLLKAHRRELYGEHARLEVTGRGGRPLEVEYVNDWRGKHSDDK